MLDLFGVQWWGWRKRWMDTSLPLSWNRLVANFKFSFLKQTLFPYSQVGTRVMFANMDRWKTALQFHAEPKRDLVVSAVQCQVPHPLPAQWSNILYNRNMWSTVIFLVSHQCNRGHLRLCLLQCRLLWRLCAGARHGQGRPNIYRTIWPNIPFDRAPIHSDYALLGQAGSLGGLYPQTLGAQQISSTALWLYSWQAGREDTRLYNPSAILSRWYGRSSHHMSQLLLLASVANCGHFRWWSVVLV